jgi:hypothetical protein
VQYSVIFRQTYNPAFCAGRAGRGRGIPASARKVDLPFQIDRQGRRPLPEPEITTGREDNMDLDREEWIHTMSRFSQYSVIHPQQFGVSGEGSGPTRRGANRHRKAESRQYTSMLHYA